VSEKRIGICFIFMGPSSELCYLAKIKYVMLC